MRFPVLFFALATLAMSVVTTAHAQPYDRGDRDRDHYGYDRHDRDDRGDRGDRDWGDRWRWRCARDLDWCHRDCWRNQWGYLTCRHDDDDRYDWRQYWLYQRSPHDYGRRP